MPEAPCGDRIPQALSCSCLYSLIHASNSGVCVDEYLFVAYTKVETSIAPSHSWLPNGSPVSVAWLKKSWQSSKKIDKISANAVSNGWSMSVNPKVSTYDMHAMVENIK